MLDAVRDAQELRGKEILDICFIISLLFPYISSICVVFVHHLIRRRRLKLSVINFPPHPDMSTSFSVVKCSLSIDHLYVVTQYLFSESLEVK